MLDGSTSGKPALNAQLPRFSELLPNLETLMHRLVLALALSFACPLVAQSGFQAHTYSAPVVQHLKAADFNRDGYPDLLTYGGPVDVYLNDGHGGMLARKYVGVFAASADMADFNGDGLPDVATCHINSGNTMSTVGIYLNRGGGSFALAGSAPLTGLCTSLTAGNVDGDGKPDIVTTSYTTDSSSNIHGRITTFFGSGSGTISRTVTQTGINVAAQKDPTNIYSCYLRSATGGDFQKAGRVDLVLIGACASGATNAGTIFYGTSDKAGHYTLKEVTEDERGFDYFPPSTEDVNGDGRPDVVLIDYQQGPHASWDNNLDFLINNGSGSFTLKKVFNESSYAADYLSAVFAGAAADFDRDGFWDAIVGYTQAPDCCNPDTPGIGLLRGIGNDNYLFDRSWDAPAYPYGIATADFNKDGKTDFATVEVNSSANTGSLILYINALPAGCTVPSSPGVHVCAPTDGGTYASPVKVNAAAKAANGHVVRMEIWIDRKGYGIYNAATLTDSITMTPGQHRIVIVEDDSTGGHIASTPVYITVQ
jgi:hypothetical protein